MCCVVSAFATIMILIADLVLLSLIAHGLMHHKAISIDADGTQAYALSVNTSHVYSSYFCRDLVANSTSSNTPNSRSSNATLYLLNSAPPLSGVEQFYINKSAELYSVGQYKYWSFYLNRGSNVSVDVCYQYSEQSGIEFYLIKGNENFSHWMNDNANRDYSVSYYILRSSCQTIPYRVLSSGRFYFVLYERWRVYDDFKLNAVFSFQSTFYRVPPSSVVHSCSFPLDGLSGCSVDIPLFSDYTALLSLNTSSLPIDYRTEADFYISCHPRSGLRAVVAVLTAIPVVAIVILVIVMCALFIHKRRGNRKYVPLTGCNTAGSAAAYSRNATFEDSTNVSAPIRANVNSVYPSHMHDK